MVGGRHRVPVVLSLALVVAAVVAACGPAKSPLKSPDPNPPTLNTQANFITGLSHPWDMAFLLDGTMFFTQRHGPVSVRLTDGTVRNLGTPPGSTPGGEGGVMGITADANFASNRTIYVCYTHAADNRVSRFTVDGGFSSITFAGDVVTGMAKAGSHNGCRIRIGPDGMLWITMGDAGFPLLTRNVSTLHGKILRVVPSDGSPAPVNPNLGGDARVFTYGHRNPQGIAFRANGEAYSVEHGPGSDDEINILVPGGDYGWDGSSMTCCGAIPALWSSGATTIAPSGATFVYGAQWRGWNGALVVAVLKDMRLQVYVDQGGALNFANPTIVPTGVRLRSAVLGPDLNLYVATDVGGGSGAIWKITPS